jgi:hypothetical protein
MKGLKLFARRYPSSSSIRLVNLLRVEPSGLGMLRGVQPVLHNFVEFVGGLPECDIAIKAIIDFPSARSAFMLPVRM